MDKLFTYLYLTLSALLCLCTMDRVQATVERSQEQTVYVPVYAQIRTADNERVFFFTVTLSIRNTDARGAMKLNTIRYHDSKGKFVREYLAEPIHVGPLVTTRFVVKESDKLEGPGASFNVSWRATSQIATPVMETIMIGTRGGQGLSFSSRGKAISEP